MKEKLISLTEVGVIVILFLDDNVVVVVVGCNFLLVELFRSS